MNEQSYINYQRIAKAIDYIRTNFREQPGLEELAEEVHLSPFHFQRLFSEWAGTTPKRFLQYITIEHAKKLLKENQITLFDAAQEIGLSGAGRLHDLIINIEGMTPAEYKYGGKNLNINYSFAGSPFGNIIVASTAKGICYMAFVDDEAEALTRIRRQFPNASLKELNDRMQQNACDIFSHDWSKLNQIKLHLKGTVFQLKVWEALLKIPMGRLTTYGEIATQIGKSSATRAVGTAIGQNPIAFLIPCHRVIQASGKLGGYMWGPTRKSSLIGWEAAKIDSETYNLQQRGIE